jgi:predicted transcriptional regulator
LSDEEIVIPQMIGFDKLIKIIIAYLKVGAAEEPKGYSEVASVAKVAANNVRLNAKFLKYIGILEGERGSYKLTDKGKRYAQALDWGKLGEANSILKETLKDNALARRTLGYVDINQPVTKDDLVSQIAIISGKAKQGRYITGIKGFVEMLVTSGLLESDAGGNLTAGKEKTDELVEAHVSRPSTFEVSRPAKPPITSLPLTLSINIDDKTDIEKLKEVLRAIKEIFSE